LRERGSLCDALAVELRTRLPVARAQRVAVPLARPFALADGGRVGFALAHNVALALVCGDGDGERARVRVGLGCALGLANAAFDGVVLGRRDDLADAVDVGRRVAQRERLAVL